MKNVGHTNAQWEVLLVMWSPSIFQILLSDRND